MTEDSPRKASDILIYLEARVDILAKHIINIDNNIKLILNKLQNNIMNQPIEIKKIEEKVPIIVENKPKIEEKIEEELDFPQVGEEIKEESSGRKVAVQQRITYSDGKNICLANVEIKNLAGLSIKKMRTNAMGKWIAVLEPGIYNIHVTKSANKTNADVELNFPVTIPESDRPIELPVPKI